VLIICNVQGTWLVCSSLTANSGPAKIYPLIYHQVLHVIIFNVQGTCLVCSNLTANSGPAKSCPLIYHQVLCADNLQCAGHVAGVL
jgi:hypothetical protein